MTTNGNITVTKIEAENFLLISKMDYTPRPGMNIFVGQNKQGKTDVIRLLKAALKGAGAEIISHGKDKASLMVRLSDGHEIRRAFTEKSKRFQIKTPEGDFKASPQAFIDAILGDADLSFDPIAFVLKDPKDQKHMLLESFNIGKITPEILTDILEDDVIKRLDFDKDGLSVLKDAENIIYTKRSEINKEVTHRKALYENAMKDFPENYDRSKFMGDKTESIQGNIAEREKALTEAITIKRQAENGKSLIDRLTNQIAEDTKQSEEIASITTMDERIKELEKDIEEFEAKLASAKEALLLISQARVKKERLLKQIADNKSTLDALKFEEVPDISAIEKEIVTLRSELEENNKQAVIAIIYDETLAFKANYETQKKEADDLTAKIKKVREELPDEIMKQATIPFESLTFEGDEVIINGNRLSLMATSEQLFATLQIYKERNKNAKLKIICADRIECLDDESYKKFWEFINAEGFQIFATKVISAQIPDDAVMVEGGELHQGVIQ